MTVILEFLQKSSKRQTIITLNVKKHSDLLIIIANARIMKQFGNAVKNGFMMNHKNV